MASRRLRGAQASLFVALCLFWWLDVIRERCSIFKFKSKSIKFVRFHALILSKGKCCHPCLELTKLYLIAIPRSRSLEPLNSSAMWSSEVELIVLIKGEKGLGFSILDYQVRCKASFSHRRKILDVN